MAEDILSAIPKIVVAMGAGYLIGKFLSATLRKDADGELALVDTNPTEKNMLLQSIQMRPAVNEELNYL